MALGFKNFVAGAVLSESDVDGLMRQTTMIFSSTSARDTALSGVLEEGLRAYTTDQNRDWVYDGSAWICLSSPWTTYTPAWNDLTPGNGTVSAKYRYSGYKTMQVRGTFTFGTTSSVTGSDVGPVHPDSATAVTSPASIGTCRYIDASGTNMFGTCQTSANNLTFETDTITSVTSTAPFTWTSTDVVQWFCEFEIN